MKNFSDNCCNRSPNQPGVREPYLSLLTPLAYSSWVNFDKSPETNHYSRYTFKIVNFHGFMMLWSWMIVSGGEGGDCSLDKVEC